MFIGRNKELQKLHDATSNGRANLIVIKGRRRIGKSRLAAQFATDKVFLSFSGLAPIKGITSQCQRDAFARQFIEHFGLAPLAFTDWSDAFSHLASKLTEKPTVVLFDEISWMASKDPTFVPKLKNWWDLNLKSRSNLTLIFCGSVSTWISKNIINSTAFFGRISLVVDLSELSLPEASQFLKSQGLSCSVYDIYKILSITGGVPWYLEQILANHTVDNNIKRLCFEKNGLFVEEFDSIFHDLFNARGSVYKKILYILASGMKSLSQIREELNYPKSGSLSKHIKALITSNFITSHYSWSFKSGKLNKEMLYRLSDNYLRFFIKYIEPNLPKIDNNVFQDFSLSTLPGWETMMGFQVENLLLKNRAFILNAIGINSTDIVADNPFFQFPTKRQKGCQIDYLIQTHSNNFYLCEFKFKRKEIGTEIIDSVEDKIKRFSIPRGFGVCPVLLHLGDVSEAVFEKRFFYRVIDISDFL